ncbi:MAG: trypsin-like peptidase domain-containing protein [Oscillospiraceae bacterium]|nr:trypsin-like peptidase domain-containing protein [Oscillospiraceae bacterium]
MFENNNNENYNNGEVVYNSEDDSNPYLNQETPIKKKSGVKKVLKALGALCAVALISVGSIAGYKYVDENGIPFIDDKSNNKLSTEHAKLPISEEEEENTDSIVETTIDRTKYQTESVLDISSANEPMSTQDIYTKVVPSVVGITAVSQYQTADSFSFFGYTPGTTEERAGTGTGIVMSEDGYILTNSHVIYSEDYGVAVSVTILMHDDTEYDAEIVGYDVQTDIAVLKVDAEGLIPAVFGSSGSLEIGDPALAIGNPLGFDLFGTLTVGHISGLNREIAVNDKTMKLIQTDAAINSGNSGGPLINDCGQVIGINSMKMSSSYSYNSATIEGLGFAIPIDDAKKIIDDLMANGYVTGRPQLGMTYRDLSEEGYAGQSGVLVTEVVKDGPAYKAGIRKNDIIVGADGGLVASLEEYLELIEEYETGESVRLTIIRNRTYYDVDVTFEDAKPQ